MEGHHDPLKAIILLLALGCATDTVHPGLAPHAAAAPPIAGARALPPRA